jgi:hypothetical protein
MRSRIKTTSVVAVAMLAVAALLHGSLGAIATQGQAVIAGQANAESSKTKIFDTTYFWAAKCQTGGGAGPVGVRELRRSG